MSTKDFKEGMVAGAKPFGDKVDQLANASESAASHIQEGLEGVTEVVGVVLDDLSAQEKKRIYDLDQATDVSALEDDEKEFLVAVLTELANTIPNVSDLQRKYLLSICGVANIATPQTSLNLACIENIENMKTQKILLRHVMEFMFIGEQEYSFLDTYEDLIFCYFSVNKRSMMEIKDSINRIYNAMGVDGIVNRYTFSVDYQEPISEHYSDDLGYDDTEYVLDADSCEDISLTGIVSVQETTEYKYKKMAISAAFAVNGELTFDSCIVLIEKNASFNVVGTLVFENCEITCGEGHTADNYAITSVNGGKVVFRNCILKNGQYFLNATGDVTLEKCSIVDCDNFIYAHSYSTMYSMKISDSSVTATMGQIGDVSIGGIAFEHIMNGHSGRGIFSVDNYALFEVHNLKTSVPHHKNAKLRLFDVYSHEGIIRNSEIECAVVYAPNIPMEQCSVRMSTVSVDSLKNSLISRSDISCSHKPIDRCDFTEMKGNSLEAKGITNCTFNNVMCRTGNFIKTTASVSNCVFSNIKLGNGGYLIEAVVDYGLGDKKQDILVSNCRVINCYTERADKKIITGRETHHKIFSDKTVPYTVICKNCMGLNQIKGGKFEEIAVMQQESSASKGAKIGAGVGAVIPGMGAIVGGAVGAVIGAVVDGAKDTAKPVESVPAFKDDAQSVEDGIRKCIEGLLSAHCGFGTTAHKLSAPDKRRLLLQMAGDDTLPHGDIIGVYDATIGNCISGNFNGILFLRDRIFVKLTKSSPRETMKYADMISITGTLSKRVISARNGDTITLSGINYATEEIEKLFDRIIALTN